jgi:hypothetical protein
MGSIEQRVPLPILRQNLQQDLTEAGTSFVIWTSSVTTGGENHSLQTFDMSGVDEHFRKALENIISSAYFTE